MNLKVVVQSGVQKFVKDNASTLLTAGGVVGTVATAVLAARAGTKGARIIDEYNAERDIEQGDLTKREKLILVVPLYLPPVLTASATIAAIVFANRISAQRAAALAAAYGLVQNNFEEYKAKVEEKLTGPKSQAIKDEIAQDRVDRVPFSQQQVVLVGNGDVLVFDAPTGRYFESSAEKIRQVVNHVNEQILHHDAVDANHFYTELGLPETKWGDEVGWNMDNLVEVDITTTMTDDQKPCLVVDFKRYPTTNYMDRGY